MATATNKPPLKVGRIYCLKNTVDSEVYVGCTMKTLSERFKGHKRDSKCIDSKLYRHMNKVGLDKYYIQLIEVCYFEQKYEFNMRENYFIKKYGTLNTVCGEVFPALYRNIVVRKYLKKHGMDMYDSPLLGLGDPPPVRTPKQQLPKY